MKKLNAKKIIVGTVISMGLALPLTATANGNLLGHPQTVEATTMKIALKHNAFLYNSKGHRVGKRKLYRGHSYTYYSVKNINGKVFYRVGKNRYIKSGNVKTSYILGRKKHAKKHTNRVNTASIEETTNTKLTINTAGMGTPKFQVSIDRTNADIFSASHTTANGSWIGTMALAGTYNVYAEDNGMYEIGNGQWIHSNIAEIISNSSSPNLSTKQDNTQKSPANTPSHSENIEKKPTKSSTSSTTSHKTSNSSKSNAIVGNLTSTQKQEVINYFVQMINTERTKNGLNPLQLDEKLSAEAQQRAIHDGTTLANTGEEDAHKDEKGNDLMPSDAGGEVEAGIMVYPNDTPKELARFAYNQFMENDADQNWAHKNNLLHSYWTTIGVGIYFAKGTNNFNFGSLVADLK